MSLGNPVVQVRVPREVLTAMDETIQRANGHRVVEDWTRSSFVLAAIKEKVAKMKRSRVKRKKADATAAAKKG